MKIVVISRLQPRSVQIFVRGSNVAYCPHLTDLTVGDALDALVDFRPRVLVVSEAQSEWLMPLRAALRSALRAHGDDCRLVVYGVAAGGRESVSNGSLHGVDVVRATTWEQAEHEAFLLCEAICRPKGETPVRRDRAAGGDVVMIGAGVVNLVTALWLRAQGHEVAIHDRMGDPLLSLDKAPEDAGATFGGKDARIFSLNESRHHLATSPVPDPAWHRRFRQEVGRDGWLSRGYDALAEDDRRWIRELESVPAWAALQYGNDVVRFNQDSDAAWRALFGLYPELLIDAHYVGRLLRVYPDDNALDVAIAAEGEIGSLVGRLGPDELRSREPALAEAIERGALSGALQVRGFSLNLHRFCRNLLRLLRRLGVTFHWRQVLQEVGHDLAGRVTHLVVDGRDVRVRDCVISPGAYGHAVRGDLHGAGTIGAMVGLWITLPNDDHPLASPLKVRRRGFGSAESAQGANVIPARDAAGRPVLHCSSGHGFIGRDPGNVADADLHELARCVMETAEDLFPDKVRRARAVGLLAGPPAFCVRPWTPSGLGLFETRPTSAGGRLVFSGAHNTGGFAQAPAVAEAVARALQGGDHPMHVLYHPQRMAGVFGVAA